ncbi:uncharacterized protein LOC111404450 [Olea europaea var. sylvestris]|uniref:uncharacterized protein LOC111404450 n=1 Tax=Olea europaea var. sylvestris TaxID=158386 RepID=UPI000C1D0347|nr:uncharacterized protein LOC111404450 [Olea europaea var. sylvestris]
MRRLCHCGQNDNSSHCSCIAAPRDGLYGRWMLRMLSKEEIYMTLPLSLFFLPSFDVFGTYLHQHKHTEELINLAGLQDDRYVETPSEVNVKYRKEEGNLLLDPSLYRQLVGSLNYLTITRPDISFAIQHVWQFMRAPRHLHLVVVHRIIRYLLGAPNRGLFFPVNSPLDLVGYSNANWARYAYTRRSITGWRMFRGTALISWRSKK